MSFKDEEGVKVTHFFIYLLTPGLAFLASTIGRKATLRFAFYSVDLKCFILLISVLTAQMKGVRVHSIFHPENAPREAVSLMPSEMFPAC